MSGPTRSHFDPRRRLLLAAGLYGAGAGVAAAATGTLATEDETAARLAARTRRWASTRFGRIAYIDRGRGPAVLFLHGFPLSSFQWRGAIDRLQSRRRCLAPDFLGLGRTEVAPGQDLRPAAQAEMLAAFLDGLGVDQVDVIANDSGGAVAQLFLTRHPARVRSLLLTNCDVETDSPPAALLPVIEMAGRGVYPDRWLVPWLEDKALARSAEGLGGMCYSRPGCPTDTALEEYLGPLVASAERKALVDRYALGLTPNPLQGLEPRLRACAVPTGIVWGMADTIFSPNSPDYLKRVLPRVERVRRLPGAKLFFPEEYPEIVTEEALALWSAR